MVLINLFGYKVFFFWPSNFYNNNDFLGKRKEKLLIKGWDESFSYSSVVSAIIYFYNYVFFRPTTILLGFIWTNVLNLFYFISLVKYYNWLIYKLNLVWSIIRKNDLELILNRLHDIYSNPNMGFFYLLFVLKNFYILIFILAELWFFYLMPILIPCAAFLALCYYKDIIYNFFMQKVDTLLYFSYIKLKCLCITNKYQVFIFLVCLFLILKYFFYSFFIHFIFMSVLFFSLYLYGIYNLQRMLGSIVIFDKDDIKMLYKISNSYFRYLNIYIHSFCRDYLPLYIFVFIICFAKYYFYTLFLSILVIGFLYGFFFIHWMHVHVNAYINIIIVFLSNNITNLCVWLIICLLIFLKYTFFNLFVGSIVLLLLLIILYLLLIMYVYKRRMYILEYLSIDTTLLMGLNFFIFKYICYYYYYVSWNAYLVIFLFSAIIICTLALYYKIALLNLSDRQHFLRKSYIYTTFIFMFVLKYCYGIVFLYIILCTVFFIAIYIYIAMKNTIHKNLYEIVYTISYKFFFIVFCILEGLTDFTYLYFYLNNYFNRSRLIFWLGSYIYIDRWIRSFLMECIKGNISLSYLLVVFHPLREINFSYFLLRRDVLRDLYSPLVFNIYYFYYILNIRPTLIHDLMSYDVGIFSSFSLFDTLMIFKKMIVSMIDTIIFWCIAFILLFFRQYIFAYVHFFYSIFSKVGISMSESGYSWVNLWRIKRRFKRLFRIYRVKNYLFTFVNNLWFLFNMFSFSQFYRHLYKYVYISWIHKQFSNNVHLAIFNSIFLYKSPNQYKNLFYLFAFNIVPVSSDFYYYKGSSYISMHMKWTFKATLVRIYNIFEQFFFFYAFIWQEQLNGGSFVMTDTFTFCARIVSLIYVNISDFLSSFFNLMYYMLIIIIRYVIFIG